MHQNKTTIFQNLGLIDYQTAWDYQEKLHAEIVTIKLENRNLLPDNQVDTQLIYQLGVKAVTDAVKIFYEEDPSVEIIKILPPTDFYKYSPVEIKKKTPFLRVVLLKDDAAKEQFIGIDEESLEEVRVQYNLAERNENFRRSVAVLKRSEERRVGKECA